MAATSPRPIDVYVQVHSGTRVETVPRSGREYQERLVAVAVHLASQHLAQFVREFNSLLDCVAGYAVRHGNSYALVIDKPILELLHITPETPLEMATNGDTLVIRPVRDRARQKRLDKTLAKINRRFAPALRKLAE